MRDKRLQQVYTTLAFLRSVIMSGEPMTNEVRNAIDDSIHNIKNVEESLKQQLILSGVVKSFYCFNEKNKRIDICGIQCTTCKDLKLMQ
jgi:hypothetical protein